MRFKAFLFLILLFKINLALSDVYTVPDVDFIESMTDGNLTVKHAMDELLPQNIKLFHEHYEAKKPSKMQYHAKSLIPKIMHHIWDGPIPPLYQNYLNECKKLHPNWEFKFWSDKDIDDLGLEYRDVYDKARNYAGRSDIARYEILYRFGGVYRDMDVKCFRPIDDLNHKYDFFVPIEPPTSLFKDNFLFIPLNNGIIGAAPKHRIFKTTLNIIRENFSGLLQEFDQSDKSFKNGPNGYHALAVSSSMVPLTQGFLKEASLHDKSIALPPTYFFSLLNRTYIDSRSFKSKIVRKIQKPMVPAFHLLRPESLMFHNAKTNKREINDCEFRYGNYMGNFKIKDLLKDLNPSQQRILMVFREIYKEKAVHNILNKNSKTPQVIHFIIFDHDELSVLEKHLPVWKMLNGDFEIKIWNKEKIKGHFQDIELNHDLSENIRFYIGLRILEKFGGTYANYKAFPHQSIFELNNKYHFYAGLMPITKLSQNVILSQKLLGSKKGHHIISNTLQKIDTSSLENINQIFLSEVYKGIYLFGTNVVFPAVYFEPLTQVDDESLLDKMKNFITDNPRAFSTYTEFTVVE